MVSQGRRASAIARLYINAKMKEYYSRLDQRAKFGGARHSLLRAATVGLDAAAAEGVDVSELAAAQEAEAGEWVWSDTHGWVWSNEQGAGEQGEGVSPSALMVMCVTLMPTCVCRRRGWRRRQDADL